MEMLFLIIASLILIIFIIYIVGKFNNRITQNLIVEANSFTENIIKTKSLEPISTHINLKTDEKAFLQCNSTLKETRNVRYYQSDRVGFRVSKRIYFGKTSGKSQGEEEFKNIDDGTLTLTNKRIVFNGSSNTRNVQISKLIAVNALGDSIEVSSENRQKSMIFTVPNPLIWRFTVKLLSSVQDPLNLTISEIESIDGGEIPNIEYESKEDTTFNKSRPSNHNQSTSEPNFSEHILNNNSKIQENYRVRRDNLYSKFKYGYDFLTLLENNNNDIWLGTATNAHLYLRNNYLAYIVVNNDSLSFRARFNNQIYSGTIDKSREMFSSNFKELILAYNGFKNGWANQQGEFYIFTNSTPNEFFLSLIAYISKLNLN